MSANSSALPGSSGFTSGDTESHPAEVSVHEEQRQDEVPSASVDNGISALDNAVKNCFDMLSDKNKKGNTPELDNIDTKGKACASTISYSIVCTQKCRNAADQGISILQNFDESKYNTPKKRQHYLQHIQAVSRKGHDYAKKAEDEFRNVRRILEQVKLAKQDSQESGNSDILEEFSKLVDLFADWWSAKVMAHQSLVDRFNSVEAINEGRIKLVHNEWTKLQETYNQYTDALNQHKEVLDKNGSKRDSWSMKLKSWLQVCVSYLSRRQ